MVSKHWDIIAIVFALGVRAPMYEQSYDACCVHVLYFAGMMDGAYFVGRKEILDWINSTLELDISKIEKTANGKYCNIIVLIYFENPIDAKCYDACAGAVACQLLDSMYPGDKGTQLVILV